LAFCRRAMAIYARDEGKVPLGRKKALGLRKARSFSNIRARPPTCPARCNRSLLGYRVIHAFQRFGAQRHCPRKTRARPPTCRARCNRSLLGYRGIRAFQRFGAQRHYPRKTRARPPTCRARCNRSLLGYRGFMLSSGLERSDIINESPSNACIQRH
jgi:hypothetical protein